MEQIVLTERMSILPRKKNEAPADAPQIPNRVTGWGNIVLSLYGFNRLWPLHELNDNC